MARKRTVTDPRFPRFWEDEEGQLWDEVAPTMLRIILAGAQSGTNLLPPSTRVLVDWDRFNMDAVNWLRRYRLEWIKGVHEHTRGQVVSAIDQWIRSGERLEVLEAQLSPLFGEQRASRIAVTEVTRIYAEGNKAAWKATGVVSGNKWQTANDELVCPICGPLHGVVVALDEGFTPDGPGFGPTAPPAHVNCILPGNEVVAPGPISAAAKSFYVGRAVEITTGGGRKITVTQHHPILTRRGWVLASEIQVGDDVYSAVSPQRIATAIDPHNDHIPAPIEKVYSALVESPLMALARMPAAAEDFHGDGVEIKGEIDIVYPNSLLWGSPIMRVGHIEYPVAQLRLNWNDTAAHFLVRNSTLNFFLNGDLSTPGSFVSGTKLPGPLIGTHGLPLQGLGLGLVAGGNSGPNQPFSEGTAIDTRLASEFILRFSSDIAVDKVVDVRDFNYSGHVYDLQCDDYGLYICNSIITHNCRCYLLPVVGEGEFRESVRDILNEGEMSARPHRWWRKAAERFTVAKPDPNPELMETLNTMRSLLDELKASRERVEPYVIQPPEIPAPVVHVEAPAVTVNVPPQPVPIVNIAPAQVIVNVPEQTPPVVQVEAPQVAVNVPAQPAPIINIEPPQPAAVTVELPEPKPAKFAVKRNASGQITGITEE